ncbi:hypothetical protein [Rhizobium mongolense]|uniref:Uncharacterized protein n=2 Tax=Rhizobium mongolense TaxID=57676 RepID=A0ABR6IW96_9HYPH|nr:hypothetical protein [Rhizobium mongolense]MBB4232197.1 hypothetical protein [Rhizobium mongolense]TVZ63083.1 hypothetical protein BCL32_3199 [Rhizobium mongolense USDA 1844]
MKTNDPDLEAAIAESVMATALMGRLLRFNSISASIMIGYVLSYADPRRPGIFCLYRAYSAEIARRNEVRDQPELPILSLYMFRSCIERLDPEFVFAARYGRQAVSRRTA